MRAQKYLSGVLVETGARSNERSLMKVHEILALLVEDGWEVVTTRGSHRQLKHPAKSGRVTVAGERTDDLHPKTAASILRQAGLEQ